MARRRHSEQSIRPGSQSDDSFTRSTSVDELSDDADLLETNEAIFISSLKGKEKKERESNNFTTIPVGWRTRKKTVDYTTYYKNNDSDSEEGSEFEELDILDSSDCSLDSDSDKEGWPPKEKKKSRSYNTAVHGNGSGYSLGKGKRTGMHKGVETPVSNSECSLDSDDVPILERLHKKRKHNPNEEGCSRAPFEEFNAVSISSSDDDEEMIRKVRNVGKRKRVTKRRHCEIPDEDFFDYYMRNMDIDGEEVLESSIPKELPMVFNFGSDDEPPVEKSEFERLTDEAWDAYDFVLGVENLGSYKPNEVLFILDLSCHLLV